MRITITAILVLVNTLVMAQNKLSGYITDKTNGEVLHGANVVLKADKQIVAPTNSKGFFEFKNLRDGFYTLEVSFIGYDLYTQQITIPYPGTLQIAMVEDPYLEDKVIVMATRADENAPLSFTEIKKTELEEINMGKDMPYLLENTPSVVTTSDAGTGIGYTGIRVRGSDATRVNVTLNGIPYNDSESQGVYWVDLPDIASSVESIQVQRGVGTSTNGAGAFGASINIQTTGLNKQPYAAIDNAFGSFNTRKHTLVAGTGLIDDAFTVDARLSKVNSDGYLDRAYADLYSYYLSAGYYGKSSLLKLNIFSGKEKTYQAWYGTPKSRIENDEQGMQDYIARNWLSQEEADNLLKSGRTYNYYTYDNEIDDYLQTHYQLLFSHDFSGKITMNTAFHYTHGKGYYEQYKHDQSLSEYGFTGPDFGTGIIDNTDLIRRRWLKNDFYGFTFSSHYLPSNKLNLTLGGAWNKYDGDHFGEIIWAKITGDANIRDRYYDNTGLKSDFNIYLKSSYDLIKNLSAYADVQYRTVDYSIDGIDNDRRLLAESHNYSFVNPKVGFNYQLNNANNVYASYSLGNKEPSRSDFIDNATGDTPKPETLHDIEIGYRKRDETLMMNTNFYYMYYKNQLVLTGALNDVGSALRTNVPVSYRTGIEIDVSYRIVPKFTVLANATFSKNIIRNFTETIYDYGVNWDEYNQEELKHDKTNISFSPEIITGGSLRYEPVPGLALNWIHRYIGNQYLDNTSNETRMIDGYYISDFRANYSFSALKMKTISLNLAVYNIFNNLYETNGYTWGYIGGGTEVHENFYYPQAGTNFMAGITLKL